MCTAIHILKHKNIQLLASSEQRQEDETRSSNYMAILAVRNWWWIQTCLFYYWENLFIYVKHLKIIFTSQGTGFTSTRNHFPLQWKRQIFPQKGSEMKYSEVMCYETEKQETALTLSKHGCSTGSPWRHELFTHRWSGFPSSPETAATESLPRSYRLCPLFCQAC